MKILIVEDERLDALTGRPGAGEDGHTGGEAGGNRDPAATVAHVYEYDAMLLDADGHPPAPGQIEELLARLRKLARPNAAERRENLRYGPIVMHRLEHQVVVNGTRLNLTPKEFLLLEHFLLHPEQVVRRKTLLTKVWNTPGDPDSNLIDVHVGNLRRKIASAAGEKLLQTVRGVGFTLRLRTS